MIKYIATFELLRKRAALSIAILIGITILFITIMAESVNQLSTNINKIEEYEALSVERFLEASLESDRRFLNLWETDWEVFLEANKDIYPIENIINRFVDRRLRTLPQISQGSIVLFIKYDDEIIFLDYADLRYKEYEDLLLSSTIGMPEKGQQLVLNETDTDIRFGTGNRMYLNGIVLYDSIANPLYLYIGFHEQIMYDNFINTLDLNVLYELRNNIQLILYKSVIFLILVILYGVALMFLIRWFTYKTMIWFAKIHPFGEIAVEKGFLTEEQADECLKEQNIEFKKLKIKKQDRG